MIRNVVFDVGMVLADFRFREYMSDLGFDKETIEELSEKVVFSDYWKLMDNGLVNDGEAKEHFISELPQYEKEMNLFWDNIDNIIREYDYSEELVKELKAKGFKVYVLSNYPEKQADMHWPKFKFLPHTDGYLISSKEKMMKPDPEFYRLLEKRFGVDLTESVFVDDREENVEAARALGMTGIVFKGFDDLKNKLKAIIY
ncbi:MAG: HAD family phosphatase [Eubacterium sp.]|nr:HAD family phosphatase [Eubacterium sp.]